MISFRVSEREFEMLKTLSESEGARSVSDFARDALCAPRNGAAPPAASAEPAGVMHQLRSDIEELKASVRHVAELLAERERDDKADPRATVARPALAALSRPTGRI
jgi:hypothetical protein